MVIPKTKICKGKNSCGIEKPNTEFHRDKSKSDGLRPTCKTCRNKHKKELWELNHDYNIEIKRKYRINNVEKIRIQQNQYYHNVQKHSEITMELKRKSSMEYRQKTPEKQRRYWLKHKYNITPEEYNKMFEIQHGVCYICNKPSKKNLAVDHNHNTGKIRGLLCSKCNASLGWYETNYYTINEYMEKNNG